jgi:hypothetical protein
VDVASYAYPNHGTTEWNCPNATGTGTSETYFYATVVVRLGASFNKPASTRDHVSAHEYGHALGLDHAGSSPLYVLMAGGNWPDTYCTGCRLSAASDDIAGMNTQYK